MIADINPIGAISKTDLKKFIAWSRDAFDLPILDEQVLLICSLHISADVPSPLPSFLTAVPTAELEPITETYVQSDEVGPRPASRRRMLYFLFVFANSLLAFHFQADMGMTYDELSVFGRLRKVEKCGPYSMYTKLLHEWGTTLSPTQVSEHRLMERTRQALTSVSRPIDRGESEEVLLRVCTEPT